MKNEYVVTGSSSGIGKFLKENLNALSYNRFDKNSDFINNNPNQIIIHAAFNMNNKVYSDDIDQYIEDTYCLTKKILKIPNKRIVFISSIDVYPNDQLDKNEDKKINLFETNNLYALSKLICENLIQMKSNKPIILRLGYLVGNYMRNSNVKKAILGGSQDLTISSDSYYNIITYKQVLEILKYLIDNNNHGIYNITSKSSVRLKEICDFYKTKATFGNYIYKSPSVSTKKIERLDREFNLNYSKEKIIETLRGNI